MYNYDLLEESELEVILIKNKNNNIRNDNYLLSYTSVQLVSNFFGLWIPGYEHKNQLASFI